MNSIRVKSQTAYTIEVNDNGDTLTFDTSDLSLTSKFLKAFERLDELSKEYDLKAKVLDKMSDSDIAAEINGVAITEKQKRTAEMLNEYYSEARKAMDIFLGDGACQKIFGDSNWLTMFDDLTEQLKPHFEKMGINADKVKKNAAEKYKPNNKKVLR